ncbi:MULTISPECIES: LysE family translocator [Rhizobium/Agrobacterium group]|jgi:RhtB (resistance to homoserine/threonine) family protein|uniref:LysE family translocator n=1 Tax=Rhizobium/Agrobacterium group TaxID=227290 RepID=UPI002167FEFA|nr:LysE family translocator [Rhizobium sp. BIGb0125]MCS4245366.1 RhtB (resistance to homoserine/threonine) family protein [Rhizobium sp. BIGb0125]
MHAYLIELLSLMAIFAFAIVSPGADLAMVMRQAIVHGRGQAIITSFGIGAALMVHVSYTILGLGLVISQSIYLFNLVKWLGVAYLLYIGIKALRAGKTDVTAATGDVTTAPRQQQSALKAFTLGFAANALNPKAVFFFLSIFSTVVSAHTPIAIKFSYGLVMASFLILWFIGVSLFMTTPRMRAAFSRASQWIDRTSGVVFIALGIKLATEKAA